MAGNELRKPRGWHLLAAVTLAAAVYAATRPEPESAVTVPAQAAGWHGAMEMYHKVALWAGRRAMEAELKYWEAVQQ
jgi:hypothetical protein